MQTDFSIYVTGNILDLSGDKINDLTGLGVYVKAHKQIKYINLSNSNFSFSPSYSSEVSNNGNYVYGTECVNKIFSFNQGTTLDLSHNENLSRVAFLSKGLSVDNFLNIEELNISHCKIKNFGFTVFLSYGIIRDDQHNLVSKYSNLKVLNFSHNEITDLQNINEITKRFRENILFENLKILDLSYNKLEYNDVKSLFKLFHSIPNFHAEIKFDHQENITAKEYIILHSMFDNTNLKNENVDIIKQIAVNIDQDNFELIKTILNANNFEKNDLKDLILSFNYIKNSNLRDDCLTMEQTNYFNELTGILEHSLIDN